MSAMQFSCPHCSGLFQVDATFGGQQISCPHCRGVVALPPLGGPPAATAPSVPQPYGGQPLPTVGPAAPTQIPGNVFGSGPPQEQQLPPPNQPVPAPTVPQQSVQPRAAERPLRPMPVQPAPHQPRAQQPQGSGNQERPLSRPAQPKPVGPLPTGPRTATGQAKPIGSAGQHRSASPTPMRPVPVPASTPKPMPSRPGNIDARQSPGTGARTTGQQAAPREIPSSTSRQPIVSPPGGATGQGAAAKPISVSTSGDGLFNLREPVKTVGVGDDAVELKSHSPEEKARRRLKKNLILWGFGLVVIGIALVALLLAGPLRM